MITTCPICRYSLEGLPERHRCPECAFEYDKRGTAFAPPAHGKLWWMVLLGSSVALLGFALAMWFFWGRISTLFVIGVNVWVMLAVNVGRARKAKAAAVIVFDDRVDEIKDREVIASHSLEGINRASWSFVDGKVRLFRGDIVHNWFRLNSQAYPNRVAKAIGREIHRRVSTTRGNQSLNAQGLKLPPVADREHVA